MTRSGRVIGVAAVLVALVSGLAVSSPGWASSRSSLRIGRGTATITWKPVPGGLSSSGNPPQPFVGTVEGIPLSGVTTTPGLTSTSSTSSSSTVPSTVEFFRWRGRMGGQRFDIGLYATYSPSTSASPSVPHVPAIMITGRWGTLAVNGRIAPPTAAQLRSGAGPAHFYGTVGTLKVSGSVMDLTATGNRHRKSGTATFTVSK